MILTFKGAAVSRSLLSPRRWRPDKRRVGELADTVLPRGRESPPGRPTTSPSNSKLKLISPVTRTGMPDRQVGVNFHRLAAFTAASRSRSGPDTGIAETTWPFSSIVTSTTTLPDIPRCLAWDGYSGSILFVAEPTRTPADLRTTFCWLASVLG